MGNKNTSDEKNAKQSVKTGVIYTKHAKSTGNKDDIIKLTVKVGGRFNDLIVMHILYDKMEKIEFLFQTINQYLQTKHDGIRTKIMYIDQKSFTGAAYAYNIESLYDRPITAYGKERIIENGLNVKVQTHYEHRIFAESISCKYMKQENTTNPIICPIYKSMKEQYEYNQQNLKHLREFTHFIDAFNEKPICKYSDECKSYKRQETGGNRLNDECHMKLYRHPPRSRNIKLSENVNSLIINKFKYHNLYNPETADDDKYKWTEKDGWLPALISEVISNGFKNDLCLDCGANDECKHKGNSILNIVNEKMDCKRHKAMDSPLNRGQMLSLVLYTGCDCNYDLCSSQRNGDYDKWKWFDLCLWSAISALSMKESGEFSVFTGLSAVKLTKKYVKFGHFVTYVSTSWQKEVSQSFLGGNEGMIIQIDKQFKNLSGVKCCDVSWISKFSDECEILFARSLKYTTDTFSCVVLDDSSGVQTVSLQKFKHGQITQTEISLGYKRLLKFQQQN